MTPFPLTTIHDGCTWAVAQGLVRLEAQMLTLFAVEQSPLDRAWLLSHDNEPLSDDRRKLLQTLVQRRLGGEPIAYITGTKEFYGLPLQVDARVLDPRDDTETLVDWALNVLRSMRGPSLTVIDLGTGSGAIALAIKAQHPSALVHAVDASAQALAVASANASRLGLDVVFHHGSWLAGVPDTFHLIVSNPPYIAHDDPHLATLRHEPSQALCSGVDGLDDIRTIVNQSAQHLVVGGWLLLEHGWNQATEVAALLNATGFTEVQSRNDLAGTARCTGGCWTGG